VVQKVDLDGIGLDVWFPCCTKSFTAHRQEASEFVCGTEAINTFAKTFLDIRAFHAVEEQMYCVRGEDVVLRSVAENGHCHCQKLSL